MKRGILCVVKEPTDLPDLDRFEEEWEIAFAQNCTQALEMMTVRPFDVVVLDLEIERDDNGRFLGLIMDRYPDAIRIMLFDPLDKRAVVKSDGKVHQYIVKRCAPETLITTVHRARLLNKWLNDPAIKRLLPRMHKLPSVPSVYVRLVQELKSPDTSVEVIGMIVADDFAMTAKLLQLVNSAFFGLGRTITSPAEAVSYLGIERTKALVLLAHTFSKYELDKSSAFSFEELWAHALVTGKFARWISQEETNDPQLGETAFTAGLLHDVGKLMTAVNLPEDYNHLVKRVEEESITFEAAEREILGTTHAELGACVLGIWGLPLEILEAIAFHHVPNQHSGSAFSAVTAVHVADSLEHELNAVDGKEAPSKIDLDYLKRLGLSDCVESWRKLCRGS
ncbi:MAG: response regulator [Verrucomicrobiota bacterium]